jgi:secreted trypsin-like serine protease
MVKRGNFQVSPQFQVKRRMLQSIFVVTLFALAALADPHHRMAPRMAGGKPAEPHSAPYVVSIRKASATSTCPSHRCGGTIISCSWVLTAGNCVSRRNRKYVVYAGAHDFSEEPTDMLQVRNVQDIIIHPAYSGEAGKPYDLALMSVTKPFEFDAYVHNIGLPEQNSIPTGYGVLFSWGDKITVKRPTVLQYLRKPIIAFEHCREFLRKYQKELHNTTLCTGPLSEKDAACPGDNGSPLVGQVKGPNGNTVVLIGVVSSESWTEACGAFNFPIGYTRVSAFIKWIGNQITPGELYIRSYKCKILRKWEILANLVSKSAPIRMRGIIHFGALKTNPLFIF